MSFCSSFILLKNIIRSLIRLEKPEAVIPQVALHHIQFPNCCASFSLEE